MTSELEVILALGLSAIAVALLLARLLGEPPVRLRRSVSKIVLSVAAAIFLLPFAAIAAGTAIVIASPVLLFGPLFLLLWRKRPVSSTEVDSRKYVMPGRHATSGSGAHPA